MQSSQQTSKSKMFFRATSKQRLRAIIVFVAIAAFFMPFVIGAHTHTDMGKYLGRCGFRQRTGIPCPTCGMTTATLAFAGGRFLDAFYIQPACGFICMILVFVAILSLIIAVTGLNFRFVTKFFEEVRFRHIILALIIIIAAGYAVTLARALAQG